MKINVEYKEEVEKINFVKLRNDGFTKVGTGETFLVNIGGNIMPF